MYGKIFYKLGTKIYIEILYKVSLYLVHQATSFWNQCSSPCQTTAHVSLSQLGLHPRQPHENGDLENNQKLVVGQI